VSDPGWYPHPAQPGLLGYWDGAQWTEHVRPAASTLTRAQRKARTKLLASPQYARYVAQQRRQQAEYAANQEQAAAYRAWRQAIEVEHAQRRLVPCRFCRTPVAAGERCDGCGATQAAPV
jgi:hypothetical protein